MVLINEAYTKLLNTENWYSEKNDLNHLKPTIYKE